ncbi:hypothetical protein BHE74_00002956 [Ensete ventricosum]|uniref:Uncharacterized protein n=1 Tax=Ensete ventricosum TaxID=4639 RepID=A0A444FN76_ENSVE|nr:hypothetical protein B296_00026057 [Ensete ventricosum]RWW24073.1 hypothetical protein GW17_00011652 [Ensete ventricosum]RWW88178.1 hypothetical protein BHE74_00002956 [Ensete ventricosum]RZR78613.1 hypothetical protein BHM03_00004030 [Ensete ventricosum]
MSYHNVFLHYNRFFTLETTSMEIFCEARKCLNLRRRLSFFVNQEKCVRFDISDATEEQSLSSELHMLESQREQVRCLHQDAQREHHQKFVDLVSQGMGAAHEDRLPELSLCSSGIPPPY